MKTIITAKLKLHTDSAQFQALRHTQLAYRAALNYVSQYSFTHGKMSNQQALQRDCYDEIRLKYGLPAQMACNVPPPGRGYLQSLMDEGEAKRCSSCGRQDQETLQGIRYSTQVRISHADL